MSNDQFDHPTADTPSRAEDRPLLEPQSTCNLRRVNQSSFTTFGSRENTSEKPSYAPPTASAQERFGHGYPIAHANHENNEFVKWDDFWDTKKGWMKFWDPALTWSQITTRDRDSTLFCFDAFRCFAFLWVSNSHLLEGMEIFYNANELEEWGMSINPSIAKTSFGGVVVFFVVSGFLNLMVSMSIARRLKDKIFSFKAARTFMFRRFMHLAPNLYLTVLIALFVGCISSAPYLVDTFCSPCKSYWWSDYVLIGNFADMIFGSSCFNSTWTVSAQMQLYFVCLGVKALYFSYPMYAFGISLLLVVFTVLLRTKLVALFATSPDNFAAYVYEPFYCRMDSYVLGMMLWMIYDQVMKPIRFRLYVPKDMRNLAPSVPSASNDNGSAVNGNTLANHNANACESATERDAFLQPSSCSNNENSSMSRIVKDNETFESLCHRYVAIPIQREWVALYNWMVQRIDGFFFFHQHASWTLIASAYTLYPIMFYFAYLALEYSFVCPSSYWWLSSLEESLGEEKSEFIIFSYALFAIAAGTMGLLFFALEGTFFPWSYVCSWWIWYPIGMLSYTGYLLSIMTMFVFFSVLTYVNGGDDVSWDDVSSPGWVYLGYYLLLVSLNLVFASGMSFLVERPLMNLSKAIDV